MLMALAVIGFVIIIGRLAAEGCQKPYDKGSINNSEQFWKDTCNPDISPRQLDKNIKAGKYR